MRKKVNFVPTMEQSYTHKKAIIVMIFCTLLLTLGQFAWKIGVELIHISHWISFFNVYMIIGVILYAVSSVLVLYALKHGELSILYPILATSYVWVSIISPIIFNEVIHILNIVGVLSILLGVSLLGAGAQNHG
jgi:uncharacterized membrane protein